MNGDPVAPLTKDNQSSLLCRWFGHKWTPTHRLGVENDQEVWVYLDHMCLRCFRTEKRMPLPGRLIEAFGGCDE